MSTHLNPQGMPHMVDVGHKPLSRRRAVAQGTVVIPLTPDIGPAPQDTEWLSPKGPIFQTAIIAGIQAAKNTSQLIPLCHPLPLTHCDISITPKDTPTPSGVGERSESATTPPFYPQIGRHSVPAKKLELLVTCTAETTFQTGVEMEALTGVSVACLTIYDMAKSLIKDIVIQDIHLVSKTGGTKKS